MSIGLLPWPFKYHLLGDPRRGPSHAHMLCYHATVTQMMVSRHDEFGPRADLCLLAFESISRRQSLGLSL